MDILSISYVILYTSEQRGSESTDEKAAGQAHHLVNGRKTMAGYYGYSKSNNALYAEAAGMRVASKITADWLQQEGIDESAAFVKWLIRVEYIDPTEWHHSSKYYNRVNYYDAEDIRDRLQELTELEMLDPLKTIYSQKPRPTDPIEARYAYFALSQQTKA